MKYFLLLTLWGVMAFGQSSENRVVEGAYFPNAIVQKNYVKNSTCDKNANDITVGGAMGITSTATNRIKGPKSCGIDAASSGDAATWTAFTAEQELTGQNCEFKAKVLGDASLYNFGVLVGGNPAAVSVTMPTAASGAYPVSINFPCPASGTSVAAVMKSTGNGAAVTVDDLYLGLATNIGTVAQSRFVGSIAWATGTGCYWSNNTSNSPLLPSADTDCATPTVEGSAVAPGTKVPEVTFTGLTVGKKYVANLTAFLIRNNVNAAASVRLYDGAGFTRNSCYMNNSTEIYCPINIQHQFTATGQSHTLSVYLVAGSGTAGHAQINGQDVETKITLHEFPSESETVVRADLAPAYWSGYHADTCVWSRTNASYGDFTADATCSLVQRQGTNISCSSSGGLLPAISCTLPRMGMYYVCAQAQAQAGTAGQGAGYRLWDGTTTIAENGVVGNVATPMPICGFYNATNLSPTFTIQGRVPSGTVNLTVSSASNGPVGVVEWQVFPVGQNIANPILVGSVSSDGSGAFRHERASINCDAGSAINRQTVSTFLSSVGNISSGACALTFGAGITAANAYCNFTPETRLICRVSSTNSDINCMTDAAVNATAFDGILDCLVPR